MRRGLRTLAITIPILILLGAAVVALRLPQRLQDRFTYGTFDMTGPPPQVVYCERRYLPSRTLTRAGVNQVLRTEGSPGLRQVETAPASMPVLVPVSNQLDKSSACSLVLWVQSGPDTFIEYALSGGP